MAFFNKKIMNIKNLLYGHIIAYWISIPLQLFLNPFLIIMGTDAPNSSLSTAIYMVLFLLYIVPALLIGLFYIIFLCLAKLTTGRLFVIYKFKTKQHKFLFIITLIVTVGLLCSVYYYSETRTPKSIVSMKFLRKDLECMALGLLSGYAFCSFLGTIFSPDSKIYKRTARFCALVWRYRPFDEPCA